MSEDRSSSAADPHVDRCGAKFPRPRLWLIFALLAGLAAWAQNSELDHAIANIVTLVSVFLVLLGLTVWFSLTSDYPRRLRIGLVAVILIAIGVTAILFRIEQVSGEMVPKFVFRWTAARDQLLEKPRAEIAQPSEALLAPGQHDFPQFLGPTRSMRVDGVSLDRNWHTSPPQLIWKRPIGAAWSSFAIVGRAAMTMEQRDEDELVTCYDLHTGKLLWWHGVKARHDETLGGPGPRSTPTIDDGRVYAMGATGILRCLAGDDGHELWRRNVTEEYGLTHEEELSVVAWGRSASPLMVDNLVVVPAGGRAERPKVSLVAYDKLSGDKVWEGGDHQIGFSSPALYEICGVRQILIVNEDNVSSHDPASGRVLWQFPWLGNSTMNANTSQAVAVSGDRVFISKGYGGGAALFQIRRADDGKWTADELWHDTAIMKTKFTNVAIQDGFVYGLSDGILECIELDTGKRRWKQGRYGHGQILLVGDVLIVQGEAGEVALVAATPQRYEELGQFDALEGKTWTNPALSGSYLLVRNAQEAACYKLPLKK